MKKQIFSILIVMMSIILISCSNQDESNAVKEDERKDVDSASGGVELLLLNVGKDAKPSFEKFFYHIEESHENMIYRKTERTSELFKRDRPELSNAKLIYDGEENHIVYAFSYTPDGNDLLFSPDSPALVVGIGSYLYIQNAIRDYILSVKADLQEQGIYFGDNPTVSYIFETPDDAYLQIDLFGSEALVIVKNDHDPTEYTIQGSFATGTVTLAVKNPIFSTQGELSNEAKLIEFFGVTYDEFLDAIDNAKVLKEEIPEEVETPLDQADELVASSNLTYQDDEYGLTIHLPETWQGRYGVSEGTWMQNALKTIDFSLMHEGEAVSNLFSIIIFDMSEDEFMKHYEGGFIEFITKRGDVTIGYNIPGEPPLELLEDESKQDLLMELSRMINEDVPEIISQMEY